MFAAGTKDEVRFKALCDIGGRAKVGVALMELPPKCDTAPAHWHSLEEEHLYVLAGRATLHLGDERLSLEPGSYVCFPGRPTDHAHARERGQRAVPLPDDRRAPRR